MNQGEPLSDLVQGVSDSAHSELSAVDDILRLVALHGYARFDMATAQKADYAEAHDRAEAAREQIRTRINQLEARNRELERRVEVLEANEVDGEEMNRRHNAKLDEMSNAYVELEARLRRSEARVVELEKD